jgi:adenine deaminase
MAEQGMPIADVLRTATVEPQRAMRRDEAGTIEVGKRADLILLRANPLEAIANLAAIDGVAVRGRWLDRAALDHILDDVAQIYAAHAGPTRADLDRAVAMLEQLRDRGYPLRDRLLSLLQEQRSEATTKKSRQKKSP